MSNVNVKEAAHTPGPWRIAPYYEKNGRASKTKIQGIYEPIPGQEFGSRSRVMGPNTSGNVDDAWIGINEANAHLIAAAPEMYEALKRIVHEWDGEPEDMAEARAAIAKAEQS